MIPIRPALALLFAALVLAPQAFAQTQTPAGTAAGTQIENQATADYIDSAGNPQSVNSDLVITTVQQVYGVSVTPDGNVAAPGQTRDAIPGSPVYYPYTLTNTGNGTDTFQLTSTVDTSLTDATHVTPANITFYIDDNGDGVLQSGENTAVTEVTLPATTTDGANTRKLIMAYDVPAGVDTTDSSDDVVIATPVATSQGDATKVDNNNYHRTNVVEDAAIVPNKSVSQTSVPASGARSLTYTITVENTGSADATNIVISDTLPSGVSYDTSNPATTSPTSGSVSVDTSGATPEITATFATVAARQSVTLTIPVTVTKTTPGSINNDADVTYTNNAGTTRTITTNTATTNVQASIGVALGPDGDPDGDPSDVQTVASANAGSTVDFTNTVQNTGTDTDTFNLTVNTDDLNLPSDATVQLLSTSGAALPTGGDGVPDTGPLGAGETFDFIVRVRIPGDTPTDNDGGDTGDVVHSVVVTATSVTDSSTSDPTTNTINDIVGAGVAFGNDADADDAGNDIVADDTDGRVDNANSVNEDADSSDIVVFPMDVVNTGGNSDTFTLDGSVTFGPTTVSVVYYATDPDADGDGTVTQAELDALTPITNTGSVDPDEEITVFAVVSVPSGATPQTATVNQTIDSPDIAPVTFNLNTVTVNEANTFTFSPDRDSDITSPGTVTYEHTITNTGNRDLTAISLTESESGVDFDYSYSYDGTTFYGLNDSSLTLPATLEPGDTQSLFVRVSAPQGYNPDDVNVLTLTATATFPDSVTGDTDTAQASVIDRTTVVSGDLSLDKSVNKATAAPGETITYTVVAKNLGNADLTEVVISDPLPAFTDFVSVSASASGFASAPTLLYSVDGVTYTDDLDDENGDGTTGDPLSLEAGESIYVYVDTDGDGVVNDDDDTFPANAEVTLTFEVTVQ